MLIASLQFLGIYLLTQTAIYSCWWIYAQVEKSKGRYTNLPCPPPPHGSPHHLQSRRKTSSPCAAAAAAAAAAEAEAAAAPWPAPPDKAADPERCCTNSVLSRTGPVTRVSQGLQIPRSGPRWEKLHVEGPLTIDVMGHLVLPAWGLSCSRLTSSLLDLSQSQWRANPPPQVRLKLAYLCLA